MSKWFLDKLIRAISAAAKGAGWTLCRGYEATYGNPYPHERMSRPPLADRTERRRFPRRGPRMAGRMAKVAAAVLALASAAGAAAII